MSRTHKGNIVIEELNSLHNVAAFSCGKPSLDVFLTKYAISHPRQGLSKTWVAVKDNRGASCIINDRTDFRTT